MIHVARDGKQLQWIDIKSRPNSIGIPVTNKTSNEKEKHSKTEGERYNQNSIGAMFRLLVTTRLLCSAFKIKNKTNSNCPSYPHKNHINKLNIFVFFWLLFLFSISFLLSPALSPSFLSLSCVFLFHWKLFSISFCAVVVFYRSVYCIIMFYADLVYAICVMAGFHGSENGKS